MTRLVHFFKHFSCAAKKSAYSRPEWKALRRVCSAEEMSARQEIRKSILALEKKLRLLKMKDHDEEKVLNLESRILSLKMALHGK